MFHPLLNRQLKKLGVSGDLPPTPEQWRKFLERVNRVYTDNDQDRYLLERSVMISSEEMLEVHDQLSKSETRYALAAQGTNDGLWDWDLISGEAYYSQRWIEMMNDTGLADFTCTQQCWLKKIHAEDRPVVEKALEAHLRGETENFENEHRVILADGRQLWILVRGLAVYDKDGRAVRLAGSMRDITLQKHFETELREAKEFLAGVIDNLPCGIVMKNYDGEIMMVSKTVADFYGRTVEEIIGSQIVDITRPEEFIRQLRREDLEVLDGHKQITTHELKAQDADENPHWWEITRRAFFVGADEKPHLLSIVMDVTERKAMESQLAQAQKLESIGQLAAGIAHEINTPTQYVGDNTRFIQNIVGDMFAAIDEYQALLTIARNDEITGAFLDQVEEKIEALDLEYLREEIPNAVNQSLDGISRISKIVKSMRDFAHPETGVKKSIDLNSAIESAITVARNEWKYVADLETDFAEDLPCVPCLAGEFNQVILNIIINAAHAIENVVGDGSNGKGKIKISTSKSEDWAEIRIADTGMGIVPKIRNRIFDPFFTTKEVGKGTGQGLAISHTVIVEKHGGSISFDSMVGEGTTFFIRLPLEPDNRLTV